MTDSPTERAGCAAAFCLLALLACGAPRSVAAAERSEGIAYLWDTERIAYRETHWLFERDGAPQRLVLYRCADGTPFARKRVREVTSALAPDFDYEDARDGYREGVRTEQGARLVFVRLNARAALETRPLPASADGVHDAGFDAFVRAHWQDLAAGGAPHLDFLIPSRFEYLPFALSGGHDTTVGGVPARQFKMRLAGWYAFALPEIGLTYDRSGRLMEFDGVGNVRDAAGKNQHVRIVFPAGALQRDVPESDIARAAAAPLASRCEP